MSERFGIAMNLKLLAAAQVRNFSFNSMCVFNGVPIAASADGLFTLDTAETDNGTKINSLVELVTSTLGAFQVKRFRKAYIGYETSGSIKITIKSDENIENTYYLTPTNTEQKQHRDILSMTRNAKGVYWMFKIENVNGSDFSIDLIEALPIYLTKGRR